MLPRSRSRPPSCFATALRAAALAAALAAPLLPARAHNVWLEPDADGAYNVQFGGHEGRRESFAAEKLQSVHAYDLRGRGIAVQVSPRPGGARVKPARAPALLAAHFDNGYFSRVGDGPMVNLPMDQNPGATSGVHAIKFHKTIVQWGAIATRALVQAFEVLPTTHRTPHAGEPLTVQVRLHGQPVAGVRVALGEQGAPVETDAQGRATLTPVAGPNQLLAILRQPVQGDARTTSRSYEFLLAFPAH